MNRKTYSISITALMLATVFLVTRYIQMPIPLGYFNVGNCVILLFCMLIDGPYAITASAIGSAFADLLSYPIYTIPTLIIKAMMPWIFLLLCKVLPKKSVSIIFAAAIATLIPLFGYTIIGGIIYGSIVTGLSQLPGLLIEYIANLVIFIVLFKPISKIQKGS